MQTETNLEKLLSNMQPILHEGEYVFCTTDKPVEDILSLNPKHIFVEEEGVSLILHNSHPVKEKFECGFESKMITLNIYSDLNAVGFLAAITEKLAAANISVNAVSAYHHDHLFVPIDKAAETMEILENFKGAS